jgi:hypothetical protein
VITDSDRNKFIAVYSDNMVFIWDYTDIKKAQVSKTFISHNGPIHDV